MRELTPNEGLVYSALLSHSLMESENFEQDGSFSNSLAKTFAEENHGYIDYRPLSTKQIMDRVEMSFPTVKKIVESLEYKFILSSVSIMCPPELLDKGFIRIPSKTGLVGQQRIFYGYLRELCLRHEGVTDRWASRMKTDCSLKSEDNVYFLVKQLKKGGFIRRDSRGRIELLEKEKVEETTSASPT